MTSHPKSWLVHERMLWRVANALGPELAAQVAFVGGCATPMLLTDPVSRDAVRFTDDVDVIVKAIGHGGWYQLEKVLTIRGFRSAIEDDIICRKRLRDAESSDLIVDFMPEDTAILGFTNRWYADALRTASGHMLPDGTEVRVVTAPYFVATKLEAYLGRGSGDPLGSTDVGDLLDLVDGRPALLNEVRQSPPELIRFISDQFAALLMHQDLPYAVESCVRGSKPRERQILETIRSLVA